MSDSKQTELTPAERLIYSTFWLEAPYSGFRGDANVLWTANRFGVSIRWVQEIIAKVNPGYPVDELPNERFRDGSSA